MFAVIYRFEVISGQEEELIQSWKELTELIYRYEGSLGSRLHLEKEGIYIAYAQWPDRQTWETAGKRLPPEATDVRARMKKACHNIETLHQLEMVSDLLKDKSSQLNS